MARAASPRLIKDRPNIGAVLFGDIVELHCSRFRLFDARREQWLTIVRPRELRRVLLHDDEVPVIPRSYRCGDPVRVVPYMPLQILSRDRRTDREGTIVPSDGGKVADDSVHRPRAASPKGKTVAVKNDVEWLSFCRPRHEDEYGKRPAMC